MDLSPYRACLIELAKASGEFIRPLFGQTGLAVETKADHTPVTAADRGAEELIRTMLAKQYPQHGIIGEEHGSDRPDAEFVWVLDGEEDHFLKLFLGFLESSDILPLDVGNFDVSLSQG